MKRYKVSGASPKTDAGNAVSAVCSDVVPVAGVDLRCGEGRVAALTNVRARPCEGPSRTECLRHVIQHRATASQPPGEASPRGGDEERYARPTVRTQKYSV